MCPHASGQSPEPWVEWMNGPMEDLITAAMKDPKLVFVCSLVTHTVRVLDSIQAHSSRIRWRVSDTLPGSTRGCRACTITPSGTSRALWLQQRLPNIVMYLK